MTPPGPPSGSRLARLILCAAALGLPACGARHIGTTAGSFLRHAREDTDPNLRYLAYAKLADPACYTQGDPQKEEAVKLLSESLHGREQSLAIRATICKSLGQIGLPSARPALLQALRDPDPLIRSEAARALGLVGTPDDATALAQVMTTDISRDCRVAAIDALASLRGADARIDLKLAEGMQNPDPAIRASSYAALRDITGQDLGEDFRPWAQLAQQRLSADAPAEGGPPITPGAQPDPSVLQAGAGAAEGTSPPR
jgi:HEAT repeat protein